jgi:hypothetical protein
MEAREGSKWSVWTLWKSKVARVRWDFHLAASMGSFHVLLLYKAWPHPHFLAQGHSEVSGTGSRQGLSPNSPPGETRARPSSCPFRKWVSLSCKKLNSQRLSLEENYPFLAKDCCLQTYLRKRVEKTRLSICTRPDTSFYCGLCTDSCMKTLLLDSYNSWSS